jgi:hypothetical protein
VEQLHAIVIPPNAGPRLPPARAPRAELTFDLSNEARPHGIAQREHDDRDRAGSALCCLSPRSRGHGDDVRLEAHALRRERRKVLAATLGGQLVDAEGPMHVSEVAQTLEEPVESWRRRLSPAWIKRQEA